MRKSLFKNIASQYQNWRAFRETRRLQELRAVSVAVQLTITGGLRRMA